jgi:hypothetical protein
MVGSVNGVQTLLKGMASKYLKEHKVYISILNSYEADQYKAVKKGLLHDEYIFFIITDRLDHFNRLKEESKSADGHVRFFIDNPIL